MIDFSDFITLIGFKEFYEDYKVLVENSSKAYD